MKQLLIATLFLLPIGVSAQEVYPININRACAAIVGIPYASDNFTDEEWQQFKICLDIMRKFQE